MERGKEEGNRDALHGSPSLWVPLRVFPPPTPPSHDNMPCLCHGPGHSLRCPCHPGHSLASSLEGVRVERGRKWGCTAWAALFMGLASCFSLVVAVAAAAEICCGSFLLWVSHFLGPLVVLCHSRCRSLCQRIPRCRWDCSMGWGWWMVSGME